MEKIKKLLTFIIPFVILIVITVIMMILFPKLMKNDIGKIEKYDLVSSKKELEFEDRVETINQLPLDKEKYLQVIQNMRETNVTYYTDQIYDQFIQFAIQQGFLQKDFSTYERSMKVANFGEKTLFDFHLIGNLNILQFSYTMDENNLYFLYKNYRKNNTIKDLTGAIDKEKMIQESKMFLMNTKLQSLSDFSPYKVWTSEEDGIYMLEDLKNDIIVYYDLIENRPVGFVKGFGNI